MSERHACRLLGQWRGTQRYTPLRRSDEDVLTRAIITLASQYGRYGYVWSYDFVSAVTHDGRTLRLLTLIDEYTRECLAIRVARRLGKLGTGTLYIEPGSPWENGYGESFNGKLWDEGLNGEIFYSLKEAQIVIEPWRVEYNTRGPHSALGYSPLVAASPVSQPRAVI